MQTRHQNKTMGLGRKNVNKRTVTRTFMIRASFRRSEQCLNGADSANLKATGKVDGNPMEDSPFAVRGRKLVKLAMKLKVPQPPLESLTRPLETSLEQLKIFYQNKHARLLCRSTDEAICTVCEIGIATAHNKRSEVNLFIPNCSRI